MYMYEAFEIFQPGPLMGSKHWAALYRDTVVSRSE
jgi:hypothetical protein